MSVITVVLVLFLSGWIDNGGVGARGNAIHHIEGFTNVNKCEAAGANIKKANANPGVVKYTCIEAGGALTNSGQHAMVIMVSGWDIGGAGMRGNSIDHLRFPDAGKCKASTEKLLRASHNPDITKIICVEF